MVESNDKKIWIWLAAVAFAVAVLAVLISVLVNEGVSEGVEISGSKDISGISCTDNTQLNFIVKDVPPFTHENKITAAFADDEFSSITYTYEGKYSNWDEADHARDVAEATYGLALAEKYGLDITAFTKNISVDGDTMYISITAADSGNLNSKTAPIFMLDDARAFPISLEEMRTAYEDAGFSCVVNN